MNTKLCFVQVGTFVLGMGVASLALAIDCNRPTTGAPMLITADCTDPRFNNPFIDVDEWRTAPVRHRYVHGGFTGTDAKFAFYFPPPEQYQGRFFQITHPLQPSENTTPVNIGFAVASGGYFVATNLGGSENARTTDEAVSGKIDPAVGGYRVNAAAAKYSRTVANKMYGDKRVYGYLQGGSGGAYQTITSAENSVGIWDGFVPFVMGTPNAIPGNFTVRIHALRVLKLRDKFPAILDAIDPGGSGDPYAGLNKEEEAALREATRMGFPPRGWWNWSTLTGGPLSLVAGYVPVLDPNYVSDFWTKPGYLGADATSSVARARIQHEATVVKVIDSPAKKFELSSMPTGDLTGIDLVVIGGAAAGKSVAVGPVAGNTVSFGLGSNLAVINSIQVGDKVRVDNSLYLALQTFHRHNIPTPDMYGWNELRDRRGDPLYPQRNVLVGPIGAFNGSGSIATGKFNGKMIVVQNLMDIDAFPWQADWYRTKVKDNLGRKVDDSFRLWYTDHAQHTSPTGVAAQARTVSYSGVLQQAFRDVAAWVEKGVSPPANTKYDIVDTQVKVPERAAQRKGIQPTVDLRVNGRERVDIAVGQTVRFVAIIQVPPNAGKVVAAEWDFEGAGKYPVTEKNLDPKSSATVQATYSFTQPGTYFPVIRATAQREGDAETLFTRIQNIGRVRVVVK